MQTVPLSFIMTDSRVNGADFRVWFRSKLVPFTDYNYFFILANWLRSAPFLWFYYALVSVEFVEQDELQRRIFD